MALTKEQKEQVIGKFKKHDGDSGSPEVQIALLTERINTLQSERILNDLCIRAPVCADLRKVTHAAQQPICDARRAA